MGRSVAFASVVALTVALAACSQSTPQAVAPQSQAANAPEFVPGEVLVQYRANVVPANARALERALGLQRAETVAVSGRGRLELVRTGSAGVQATIARLQANPNVDFAEPNWIYQHQAVSSDPYYTNGSLWGMKGGNGSNAEEAWASGKTGSAEIYVGVIDEGIQFEHPDLKGQVWTNPKDVADGVDNDENGLVDDIHGWDFANNDNTIYDGGKSGSTDDHGTHVSGTIGAKANNNQGVVGVNWSVTLISGKFLGRRGGTLANAVKAVDYFTDLKTRGGLNIVATNNSWGGGGFSQALLDAINRGGDAGILFVAAAGNNGVDNDTTTNYPSNYECTKTAEGSARDFDCLISVAAIDSAGVLANFSNYGDTKVDLGAPGVDVFSTTASNKYESYSGTSMATPHVTGAVALYASVNPTATARQIRDAIMSSSVSTASLNAKTATGGRLDANLALSK